MTYDSDSRRLTFLKVKLVLQIVIPQFVPLNSLHAGIVLRIGAVQVECLHIFFSMKVCMGKGFKMSVTSTFECTTGNGITQ